RQDPDYRLKTRPGESFALEALFVPCTSDTDCSARLRCNSATSHCGLPSLADAEQDQPVGLPPFFLEASANYLRVLRSTAQATARASYGTQNVDKLAALRRGGEGLRLAIAVESVADLLHGLSSPCEAGIDC